jgi:SAM-dependent methyltransferase
MTGAAPDPISVPLPPRRLRLHRDSDEEFTLMARQLAEVLYRMGLDDGDSVLDVGCGVGRLPIGLLRDTSFHGRYVGFDVSVKHVRWARRHLGPLSPSFRFRVVDVRNARYNPDGTVAADQLRFPVRSEAFDMACLFSVFTHFEPADTASYLRELHRVLRPGGRAVATWFLWDEARRHDVESGLYPMRHDRGDGVLYADPNEPLWAIAHHLDLVRAMIATAGLELERVELGTWAHGPGPEAQDLVVLRKPSAPPPTLRRRVVRRLRRATLATAPDARGA